MNPSPFPPPNYQQAASTIPGITVWQPVAAVSTIDAPKTYTCPQCGANTRYDIAAGGVACEYCGYIQPAAGTTRQAPVGRRAQEFEFTLETLSQAEQGWGMDRRELVCDNCGASLTLPESFITVTCPFCASNKVNVRSVSTEQLRPRFLVPFKIQPEEIRRRAQVWLGKGWFHPAELSTSAVVERLNGVYLPFWTFGATIAASWKAEVGHPHQESYYDSGSKSWKTRTVIKWRWEDGQVKVKIDDLVVTGSSRLSHLILERLRPFNLNELVAYAPDYLAGWQAQAYDVTLPQAWEQAKTSMRETSKKACYTDINSAHVRNFSMTGDFGEETWRYILLPVYLTAYRFENKVYQVMANGQTAVVAGQKPVAWWKVWLAIAALLLPGLVLGLVGLVALLADGMGAIILLIAALLLVGGGAISVWINRQALASEAA
jgi:DNA-directed RNA polymerase subunit RPC12/RpoP